MQKKIKAILTIALGLVIFTGCEKDANAGASIVGEEESILVFADTFGLRSVVVPCDSFISSPDSFMLGEMTNAYGTIHASILAQLACPEGFAYPQSDSTRIDSIELGLYFRTAFGDTLTPMSIDVKRMDLKTFDYNTAYSSNLSITDYVSADAPSILAQEKIVTAQGNTIKARMSDDFVEWFEQKTAFPSQTDFNNWFKGIYICSSFGGSTILNVRDIQLLVHYSFSYPKNGKDTVVHDTKAFYANSEVRQVNTIHYDNQDEILTILKNDSDTYNYILAPANIYTRMSLPMKQMASRIMQRVDTKRPYVNMAKLRVRANNMYIGEARDGSPEDWAQPAPYILLLKESALDRFFSQKELPSDTCAILASLTAQMDEVGDMTYYYEYDLSSLITNLLRHQDNPDQLDMLLIPVDVQTSTNTSNVQTITAIKQQQTLSATVIYSARNTIYPLSLEVIYSGF